MNRAAMNRAAMRRRNFIPALAAGPLGVLGACATPLPDRHAAAIAVQGIEIVRVHVNHRGNWVFVKVHTNEGLVGLGEASGGGRGDPQVAYLEEFAEWMKGRSIYDIEAFQAMASPKFGERPAPRAASGFEQALYDLQGQAAGVPCYQLFGGKLRDEIRNYANINRSTTDRTPDGFAATARRAIDASFDAIKMASFDGMPRDGSAAEIEAHTQLGIDCIAAVREVIGPDRDLLVDGHSNFDLKRGYDLLERLEPLNLYWLEEVTRPFEDLAELHRAAKMTFAGGESLIGLKRNLEYIKAGTVDIMMPDVKTVGGMSELKKISVIAEAAGLDVAPHGPSGPVGNMAAAHICVGLPNFNILEFSYGETDWRSELVDPPEDVRNGMLAVSDRPGLGLTLNDKVAADHAVV